MNNRGVTLVELLVAMGIIGILLVVLAFNYQNWMGRYNVEKAVKDLYSDLMFAKMEAMTKAHSYIVDFPTAKSYRLIEDTNDSGAFNGGDTILPTFSPSGKTVQYTIYTYTYDGSTVTTRTTTDLNIIFDKKGRMTWLKQPSDIYVDPENPVTGDPPKIIQGVISFTMNPGDPADYVGKMQADYDCIVLSPTKINIGQMQKQGTKAVCNVK